MSAAQPYARALYAAAGDEGEPAETVLADLDAAIDLLEREPAVAAFLSHPALPPQGKRKVLQTALGGSIRPVTLRFLLLLTDKRRFSALPDIVRAFRGLVEAALGIGQGRLETARAVSAEELAALEAAASRWLGTKVRLQADVRPELIGGARIIFGDRVIDGSLAGRIQRLGRQLRA